MIANPAVEKPDAQNAVQYLGHGDEQPDQECFEKDNLHLFGSSTHCFLVVASNRNSLKAAFPTKLGES